MDQVLSRVLPLLRIREIRVLASVLCAIAYYGVVVAGEIGRTGSIVVSAVPAALALIWFRTRPRLSMSLSAAGLLLVAWLMTNGFYVQDVTQQSAVLVAIFGGAMNAAAAARRGAVALAFLTCLLIVPFAYSRYADTDLGAGPGTTFGIALIALVLVALGAGAGLRLYLDRDRRLGADLLAADRRGAAAERDVLMELERNRIAREVHDVVAHSLAVVIAQADGARFAVGMRPETVAPALEAIGDTARRALGEVRTMLHDLRTSGDGAVPGADDLGALVEGVRELGVAVDEAVYGTPAPLDRDVGLALYRVAQEALTNAMRHGDRAEPVGFELDWGERQVVLVVTNGMAADAAPASERTGQGLVGMRERAADAGGDCSTGRGSNGRFRVRVVLPISAPQQEAEAPGVDPLTALLGRPDAAAHG